MNRVKRLSILSMGSMLIFMWTYDDISIPENELDSQVYYAFNGHRESFNIKS